MQDLNGHIYPARKRRAMFNQYAVDPTCELCLKAPETRQHFISECSVFKSERQEFLDKLITKPDLTYLVN